MRNNTVHKNSLIKILQIICIFLLLTVPINLSADVMPVDAADRDWPNIIQQLEAANKKSPRNPGITSSLANAYNNYGLVLANQKQWQLAEYYILLAIQTNPNNKEIRINLSNVYFSHGYELFQNDVVQTYTSYSHNGAKQLANNALAQDSSNINAYILLGDIEYINQNMEVAQRNWQRAAQLAPTNEQIQQRLAKITREAQSESMMDTKYNMYFLIKTDPALEKLAGFNISETLDKTRIEVAGDLNYTQNFKIPVIVYTTTSFKDSIPDAPDWSEGAFDGKLRIVLTQYKNNISLLKSTIIHEYTHAIIAEITKGNIPRWFNEGIAKYMEYKYGIPPRINYLAQAYNSDDLIPWENINSAIVSSNKNQAMLAYQQSFNFIYYLVQRYGMTKLRTLLNVLGTGIDFDVAVKQVYQVPLETIQHNWRIWLTEYILQWAEAPLLEPHE